MAGTGWTRGYGKFVCYAWAGTCSKEPRRLAFGFTRLTPAGSGLVLLLRKKAGKEERKKFIRHSGLLGRLESLLCDLKEYVGPPGIVAASGRDSHVHFPA